MNRINATAALLLLASACQRAPEQSAPSNEQNAAVAAAPAPAVPSAPANQTAARVPATPVPEPASTGALAGERTPLAEPKGAIDYKSAEAAGQVVQHYGALVEQKRFDEAEELWGNAATAKSVTAQLKTYSEAHLQIGKPTEMEGAAGSSYITVPIVLYGKRLNGGALHRSGNAVLRRVNDVPGSTNAQRHWHIERIDWNAAG